MTHDNKEKCPGLYSNSLSDWLLILHTHNSTYLPSPEADRKSGQGKLSKKVLLLEGDLSLT